MQSPWQQRGFVFLMGALSVLALAPFYIVPILLVTIPLFLICHDECKTDRSAFWLGWWFGFGYFTFGLYWIANALLVDVASFWWVIPFAIMGLPFGLSFFWAIASLVLNKTNVTGTAKWLLFAVVFSVAEWLRGHILTGFPWNLIGYAWVDYTPILQATSLVGIYGLTLYTFLIGGSPYPLLSENKSKKPFLIMFVITMVLVGWGSIRIANIATLDVADNAIRLVQPNIKQKEKWVAEKIPAHFEKLVSLSAQPSTKNISAIIWPETATAFFDTFAIRQFEATILDLLNDGQHLITGVLDYGRGDDGNMTAYNRLAIFDSQAQPIQTYDKHHLVPFGEYIPFAQYLPFDPIASNGLMFTPGIGMQTLWVDGLPRFSPLICYEAIFPSAVARAKPDAPSWLLNLTNDGWYGKSTGPYQHLAITQTRAVEEGMPLVRVANTGVSALINPAGKIIESIPLQTAGVIDVNLPTTVTTLYARFGDLGFLMLLIIFSGLGVYLKNHD